MFGKKFNQRYNTIPKIRKQKKKNRFYVSKSKIGQKRILHSNKRPPWQWPAFLFVAIFVAVILVIPALIVVPFIQDDSAESVTAETDPVSVELQEGDSPFSVAVLRSQTDKIEDVPLEEYVSGVVAAEMPADFEIEALKAQALAARTYIVNHLLYQDESGEDDVTDTVRHQVYKNEEELRKQWGSDYTWKMRRINEAVAATKGEILTYDDTTITPAFFSTSNGYTENAADYWENDLPYLKSVESPWDESSPKFLDQQVVTLEEVEQALGISLPRDESISADITRTDSDRVKQLQLAGETFSGRDVRESLDLPSTDFTIEQKDHHLIFTTKGFGHGIGMSQYGANGMAKEGKTYQEIVTHYYQGVEISEVADTAPTLVAQEG
ncbi:MAG TPA: stage II sporulation protein D [Bacillota bacterium]|nr:stage II sporulation protein D [Bacillota bacterium]